jgi:hypothetical protein
MEVDMHVYVMQPCGTSFISTYACDRPLEEYGYSFVLSNDDGVRLWSKGGIYYVECDVAERY